MCFHSDRGQRNYFIPTANDSFENIETTYDKSADEYDSHYSNRSELAENKLLRIKLLKALTAKELSDFARGASFAQVSVRGFRLSAGFLPESLPLSAHIALQSLSHRFLGLRHRETWEEACALDGRWGGRVRVVTLKLSETRITPEWLDR